MSRQSASEKMLTYIYGTERNYIPRKNFNKIKRKAAYFLCFSTLVETAFFLNQSQVKCPFTKAEAQFFFDEFSALNQPLRCGRLIQ